MQKSSHAISPNPDAAAEPEAAIPTLSLPLLALTFVLLMIVLINAGCVPFSSRQAATPTVKPGTVLFADDFSHPPGGWGIWNRDGASVGYHDDGLRVQVNTPQSDFWSVAGRNFSDAQIEVDATKIGGPNNNDFGILCRYLDKDNFYLLVVSSDGYYGIAKLKTGHYSMISADTLQYSSTVATGKGRVHLRADCVGDRLSLYANGEKLVEAKDSDFASGDVGVLAGAYNEQGVDILFDNFVVKKP
jgi:hypothetical protein